jgi:protein ImuB
MYSPNYLWLCVYLSNLSINSLNYSFAHIDRATKHSAGNIYAAPHKSDDRSASLMPTTPLVIADGPESRPIVYAMNEAAHACGVRHGMTIASAKVLEHTMIALPRDHKRESRTLQRVARALLQFTPSVAIDPDLDRANIAIEISASLTLFGGLDVLLENVVLIVQRMGYAAHFGIAPNPLAAELFARHRAEKRSMRNASVQNDNAVLRCTNPRDLSAILASISVTHFAWPEKTQTALATLGLATIGDVMRQPYAGLQRRFGAEFVRDLDRAYGRVSEAHVFYEPPERFESRLDFLYEIKESAHLLQPIEALLIELEGFLRARGAGVCEIELELKQGRSKTQSFRFQSRTSVRSATHWLRLIADRIEQRALEAPVIEIALFAPRIVEFSEENESLLPQEKETRSDWFALLDRLSSKLGERSVFRIEAIDDHRPELAWRCDGDERLAIASSQSSQKIRPTWLLREPKSLIEMEGHPQYNGALSLLAGPERIDTGWWDNKPVARDYFVAINPAREVCWVFRDYRQGRRWYLHGFFS